MALRRFLAVKVKIATESKSLRGKQIPAGIYDHPRGIFMMCSRGLVNEVRKLQFPLSLIGVYCLVHLFSPAVSFGLRSHGSLTTPVTLDSNMTLTFSPLILLGNVIVLKILINHVVHVKERI